MCGSKLSRRRSVPPALTSPCAKQGVRPGQRTQMNSTGKKRLCKIPCSLTSFTSPLLFISLGAARDSAGCPWPVLAGLGCSATGQGAQVGPWIWLPLS